MDNNFSAQVKEIISFSREEALRLGNDFIGTEHCIPFLSKEVKNIVLNLQGVNDVDETGANTIVKLQQKFYEQHASFVICNLNDVVETIFDQLELLEMMNVTPTESEAWDIVQMEEIERELLDSDDVEFGVEQS